MDLSLFFKHLTTILLIQVGTRHSLFSVSLQPSFSLPSFASRSSSMLLMQQEDDSSP